jgi:hypothetical protein
LEKNTIGIIFQGTADRSGNPIETPRDFMIPGDFLKKLYTPYAGVNFV